ncbi:SWIM zinc finger family protein [Streptomyces sp. ISL-12]|nr:SWIM zinc finger family protein [Streptomyces sp. ISL-12]
MRAARGRAAEPTREQPAPPAPTPPPAEPTPTSTPTSTPTPTSADPAQGPPADAARPADAPRPADAARAALRRAVSAVGRTAPTPPADGEPVAPGTHGNPRVRPGDASADVDARGGSGPAAPVGDGTVPSADRGGDEDMTSADSGSDSHFGSGSGSDSHFGSGSGSDSDFGSGSGSGSGPGSGSGSDADGSAGAVTEARGAHAAPPTPAASSVAALGGDATRARPGDGAREALRAARQEARRSQVPAPARASAAARRPARPETVADTRARTVRAALANAFRPPFDDLGDFDELGDVSDLGGMGDSGGSGHSADSGAPSAPSAPVDYGVSGDPAPLDDTPPAPGRASAATEPTSTSPRTPRSMAAPGRDGELRRTFPAFPPGSSAGQGFAETWWGNAWVTALEEGALDAGRLARGRGYAERGHVDAITVTPGLVLAYVQGSRPRPYRVRVRLRTLDDADWERFLDAAAERPGHIAALLDKELPHSLADCGVPLLPGPGDLAPECNCPDSGHPCKHAAALCYQTARLLDADPFVLLLLRGRGERELLDALSRLSAARAARAVQGREPEPLPGVRATEALATRVRPPLPPPLPAPPHPEQPPAYPAAPGGPDPFALDQLATDAAARAHALLTTGRDPVDGFTLWQDAVRLAAARPGSGLTAATRALYSSLARATGRDTAELARAVAAWRQGGPEGLSVLEEPWDPPAGRFDRARPLLLAADLPAFRPWRNRLTHPSGHLQLRLGRTGLWYAYESEPDRDDWWPRGTPDLDPVGALTGLGTLADADSGMPHR